MEATFFLAGRLTKDRRGSTFFCFFLGITLKFISSRRAPLLPLSLLSPLVGGPRHRPDLVPSRPCADRRSAGAPGTGRPSRPPLLRRTRPPGGRGRPAGNRFGVAGGRRRRIEPANWGTFPWVRERWTGGGLPQKKYDVSWSLSLPPLLPPRLEPPLLPHTVAAVRDEMRAVRADRPSLGEALFGGGGGIIWGISRAGSCRGEGRERVPSPLWSGMGEGTLHPLVGGLYRPLYGPLLLRGGGECVDGAAGDAGVLAPCPLSSTGGGPRRRRGEGGGGEKRRAPPSPPH